MNGEFMKRTKKFKSEPWPVANKRKQARRGSKVYMTPFGPIFEMGKFTWMDLLWSAVLFIGVCKFLIWYGTR